MQALRKLRKFLKFDMEDQLYREIILEHYKNPLNYGVISNPDFEVTDSNPLCGDEIRITGNIDSGAISGIKFESEGCAISKAAASIMTEFFLGKKVKEVIKIRPEDFLVLLEINLSPSRTKCALLGYSTLKKALVRF